MSRALASARALTYTYTSLYSFLNYFLTMPRVRRVRVRTLLTSHPISLHLTILPYTYNLPLVTVSDLARALVTVRTYMLNTHHGHCATSGLLTVSSCCGRLSAWRVPVGNQCLSCHSSRRALSRRRRSSRRARPGKVCPRMMATVSVEARAISRSRVRLDPQVSLFLPCAVQMEHQAR